MSEGFEKSTRNRLNGVLIDSPDEISNYILKLLDGKLLKNSELCRLCGKIDRSSFQKTYIKPLVEKNLIKLVEGTQCYQKVGTVLGHNQRLEQDFDSSKYKDCETIKNWITNNTSKKKFKMIQRFISMCSGVVIVKSKASGKSKRKYQQVPTKINFKMNPDYWVAHDSTKKLVQALKEVYKVDELDRSNRMTIRSFILYGLNLKLSEEEGIQLGLSGAKGEAYYANLHMNDEQYNTCKKILKKTEPTHYLKFGFRFATFCRPSSMYPVKVSDLTFFDRTTEYLIIDGQKIRNADTIKTVKMLMPNVEIVKEVKRACTLQVLENKTATKYPKFIYDEEIVRDLEKFVNERKKAGMKYLFWDNNDTEFTPKNYDQIVNWQVSKDNKIFTKVLFEIGFQEGDFGKANRANYALRHFGVQWWLMQTDYDYGFIKTMGWKDITTLITWYGGMTEQHINKKLLEVSF